MAIAAPAGSSAAQVDELKMTRSKTEDLMAQSRALVSSLVSTATTLFLLASVSAFLYATFYYAYMPVEMVDMPVHLQFQPCEGQTADRCSFPTALIPVGNRQQLLQGQAYKIRLAMEMPDSPTNEDLGMFMACINVTGKGNKRIEQSCRHSITEYRSPLLRTLETVAFAPFLLLGLMRQNQKVAVEFFQTFHPDPHSEAKAFHLELKSRLAHVTRASLHVEASLTGLRYMMYRHSWISALLGVGTNILVLLAIFTISWTGFRKSNSEALGHSGDFTEETGGEDVEEALTAGPEEVEEGLSEQVEEEVAPQQTVGNKLKWFSIRIFLKLLLQTMKVAALLSLVLAGYEAAMLGSGATRETVMAAAMEDLLAVCNLASSCMPGLARGLSGLVRRLSG